MVSAAYKSKRQRLFTSDMRKTEDVAERGDIIHRVASSLPPLETTRSVLFLHSPKKTSDPERQFPIDCLHRFSVGNVNRIQTSKMEKQLCKLNDPHLVLYQSGRKLEAVIARWKSRSENAMTHLQVPLEPV